MRQHGFSMVELVIVVAIAVIVAGLAAPMFRDSDTARLRSAANLLLADVGVAQIESMTHGDQPRVVVFDQAAGSYWIAAAATPSTPITNPAGHQPYRVVFGQGRAAALQGVTIRSYSLSGDNRLGFGLYGQTDQATRAAVTLGCGTSTITLNVESFGRMSLSPLQ